MNGLTPIAPTSWLPRAERTRLHILIADDDPFTQFLAKNYLKTRYDLTIHSHPDQALADYLRLMPDLVFLDLDFGGGAHEGLVLLQQYLLRDTEANVVIVSGCARPELIAQVVAEGASGFVRKPFTKADLIQHAQAASQRRARHAH